MTTVRITGSMRPGPRTTDDYRRWVTSALRNLDDGVVLLDSPLTRLPGVQRRAAAEFPSEAFAPAFALRTSLEDAVKRAGSGSVLTRTQKDVMRSHVEGKSLTAIARDLRFCRQHVSTIWSRALIVITSEFMHCADVDVSGH